MGSGKTTLGKRLAQEFNVPFYDLDDVIESNTGKSISEIFSLYGDHHFRKLERKNMMEVLTKSACVISLGGGTACYYDNMSIISERSHSIYLRLSPKDLVGRLIGNDQERPLIKDKTEKELFSFIETQLEQREKYYNRATLKILNTNLESSISKIRESFMET